MNATRRNLLARAAALSISPLAARAGATTDVDVAIIGGGVAGAYAAWWLASVREFGDIY